MLKTVRGIRVLSMGKMAGIIYACLGLLVGMIVAMISVLGGFAGMANEGGAAAGLIGMFLGVGAVFVFPILYGLLGACLGMVVAAIYNVASRLVGGIEIEID
jgi:hypothetical protein